MTLRIALMLGFVLMACHSLCIDRVVAAPPTYPADAQPSIRYSAIPAAVPSPFSNDPLDSIPPFTVQPKTATAKSTPPTSDDVTPAIAIEPAAAKPTTVQFDIEVVEDLDGCFTEFDELQSPMPIMLSDSSTMRGTLRILKKHEHVRQIAIPKLTAPAGERAQFAINKRIAKDDKSEADFEQSLAVEVSARELGGGLAVEFQLRSSNDKNVVKSSLIVPHGQTVVMKTSASPEAAGATEDNDTTKREGSHAVYVVLTPEIVK